jgi:hypothetical protein
LLQELVDLRYGWSTLLLSQCPELAMTVPVTLAATKRISSTMGPDGKQYVAVYAGIGGDLALFANDTSADTTDVRPAADFMPNLARHTSHGGIVWIFGL